MTRHDVRVAVEAEAALCRLRCGADCVTSPPVFVVLLEHLGDIVACEPLVEVIKARHPDRPIIWFTRRRYAEILANHPLIFAVLTGGCTGVTAYVARRIRGSVRVDLTLPHRRCASCGLSSTGEVTAANYYEFGGLCAAFAISAGLPVPERAPKVHISPVTKSRVSRLGLPERFVCIHASANHRDRTWPYENWVRLVARLKSHAMTVEIGADRSHPGVGAELDLRGELSICESAEVIRRARLFVGSDSGPTHLASGVGTPSVVLLGCFGPFSRYTPYSGHFADGTRATILRTPGLVADLGVDEVYHAVLRRLE